MLSRNCVLFQMIKTIMNGSVHMTRNLCTAEAEVLFEAVGKGRVVTLNRPKALNSLNLFMIIKLTKALKEYEHDSAAKLVILKGTGDKAFCAGGDVVAVTKSGMSDGHIAREFFKHEYRLNYLIGTYEIPFVSFINGVTMGGGVGVSVHGKFRVATEKTLFAMPETAIGLFPDVGGSYFLSRQRGKLGYFLALTGHRLKGRDVVDAGVATHFVHSDKLEDLEKKLLEMPGEPNHNNVEAVLDDFHKKCREPHEFSLAPHMAKIDSLFDGKSVEEIMEKLKNDDSDWSQKYLTKLKKMSPTSMKVTFRQLQEGSKMGFKQIFTMEYRLSQRFVEDKKDFYEGVRTVLVDKDNNPKWDPASLEEVTEQKLDWYFSPLPPHRELVIT